MYAILHKPTGKFLPQTKYFKGGTYTEIGDPRPPRLFSTKTAATNCLRHWLAGVLNVSWNSDFEGYEEKTVIPQPRRKAEEMEIVEVRLEVAKCPLKWR